MARLGADPEQLDQLSRKFEQEAQQISQATQQISSQVQSTWWEGPDSDRFKNEWNGQYAAQLRRIAEALREVGQTVRRQAAQQRQTSSA
jgi:WXG100 family type VII secretion target